MAYTHVQTLDGSGAGGANTVALAATGFTSVATGDSIVGAVKWEGGAATPTVTDTIGNTYTVVATQFSDSGIISAFFYCLNCASGLLNVVTADFGASRTVRNIEASQYSGLNAGSFIGIDFADTLIGGPGTGTDAITTEALNVTSQPALVWAFAIDFDGGVASAGTGYTGRGTLTNCRVEDKRVTATGNVFGTFTTATGSHTFLAGVMAISEGAAAAANVGQPWQQKGAMGAMVSM
mgnify:CR=1 FL=1